MAVMRLSKTLRMPPANKSGWPLSPSCPKNHDEGQTSGRAVVALPEECQMGQIQHDATVILTPLKTQIFFM